MRHFRATVRSAPPSCARVAPSSADVLPEAAGFLPPAEMSSRGTGSSNPSPSSRESANHRFLSYSRGAVKSAAVSEGEIAVASTEQLHSAPLSGKGLLAVWNARPGIEKRKKVGDRDALIDQWAAIEASPEPEPQADAKRPPKQEKVIEMLRRPEGATVDEVVRATGLAAPHRARRLPRPSIRRNS